MALTVLNAATQGVPPAPYRPEGPVGGGPDSAVPPASRSPPPASSPPVDAPLLEPEVQIEPELPLDVEPVLPSEPSLDPELVAVLELVPPLDPGPPEPVAPPLAGRPEDEQASATATVPRASATRGRSCRRRRWRRLIAIAADRAMGTDGTGFMPSPRPLRHSHERRDALLREHERHPRIRDSDAGACDEVRVRRGLPGNQRARGGARDVK